MTGEPDISDEPADTSLRVDVGKIFLEEGGSENDALALREMRSYSSAGRASTPLSAGSAAQHDITLTAEDQYLRGRELRLVELDRYIQLRQWYSRKLYKFLVKWVSCIGILIIWSEVPPPFTEAYASEWPYVAGGVNWLLSLKLDNSLLIALVGGSTASVIGMIIVVAKFLFPSNHNPSRDWADDQQPGKEPA